MTLHDALERQHAIDPHGSYIVQAPAGSGKTELLTQRFLRLLGLVKAPEQILALTFTRKAANEMRERILTALQLAADDVHPSSPHQLQTLQFAKKALEQNHLLNWKLLDQPSRLQIMTIDALCHQLCHAMPLQSDHISFPEISSSPEILYLQAAKACLTFVIEEKIYQESIKILLHHVDNRQDTLLELFVDLLSKRDQWIAPLYQAKLQNQAEIESALAFIEQHELNRLQKSIDADLWQMLIRLAQRVALIEANIESPRFLLTNEWNIEDLNREYATSLAALLLTSQNTLRKSFDHHIGLRKGACDDLTYTEIKSQSKVLLESLSENPDFLKALLRVKDLPEPHYHPHQWKVLQALLTLLPLLIAHLNLVFSQHNKVDFTAISQQALTALGEGDYPTDLALYLDNTIQHVLIDEFQDTSIQQFQLIQQIIQGWEPEDGRTLFVVGDPMQSIYRFRAAEVGLFLRAKTKGIASIKLLPLQLRCNFRSTPTIVEWVNQQFQHIFPQMDDMESGAISFHASIHTRPDGSHSHVNAQTFNSKNEEATALIDIIRSELEKYPSDDIAILVRSRNQLRSILMRLREEKIAFQGVDIDLLADLPHLRDVWSLTQALLMPANRLSWIAFLRSPWCGISLADLLQLANIDPHQSIYTALSTLDQIPGLSDEGRQRCEFIFNTLKKALSNRHQQSLVNWIMETLTALHLSHVLDSRAQDDLEQYWKLLDQFEQNGQISDLEAFYSQLKKLYSQQSSPSRLKIMTIHKSKGLEFDTVILPGLSQKPAALGNPLIRWLQLPSQQKNILLISPIKAAHHERCRLYDYLGKLDAQKGQYETQRLLYVAATRAKKRLYLTDSTSESSNQFSFRALLHQEFELKEIINPNISTSIHAQPTLYRLPIAFYQKSELYSSHCHDSINMSLVIPEAKQIGIVLHAILHWICERHVNNLKDIPSTFIQNMLRMHKVTGDFQSRALRMIEQRLEQLMQCPIGQWIIASHEQERNEYELLIKENEDITTRIIDRTFCDQGKRWIIDFKTGQEEHAEKYREQVNEYAQIMTQHSSLNALPIHCGLYYLTNNHFEAWMYDHGAKSSHSQ